MKLDESCILNPKLQIGLWSNLRFRNFGFKMQDSSNFKIAFLPNSKSQSSERVGKAGYPANPPARPRLLF